MNRNTYRTLDFEAVRKWLLSYAGSSMGRRRLDGLAPLTDAGRVKEALHLTSEARRTLETLGRQPYHDLPDVGAPLTRSAWEGFALEPRELLDVASFAQGVTEIGRALGRSDSAP